MSEKEEDYVTDAQVQDNKYDREKITRMYKFPASVKEAMVHKRASQFGYNSPEMKDGTKTPICPCCQNPVNTIELPLLYGTIPEVPKVGDQKFLLNSGTSLYFTFIKMCIGYLVLRFLISDAFNMWTSSHGHYCQENPSKCSDYFNSYFSSYNKHTSADQHLMNIVDYLNIAVTIVSIIYFYFCRKYLFKINDVLEQSNVSQDDFSLLVEDIPIFIYEDETTVSDVKFEYENFIKDKIEIKIKEWIKHVKQYKDQNEITDYIDKDFYKYIVQKNPDIEEKPIVASITLCFDLSELEKMTQIRKHLMDKYINDENVDKDNAQKNNYLKHIPNQIQILNKEYMELSKKFAKDNSPSFNISHFIGKAFVTFEYQHYRYFYLREVEKDKNFFEINGDRIQVESASQPSDVFWQNMSVSNEERSKSLVYSYVVMVMFLIFSLALLVAIEEIQFISGRKMGTGPGSDFDNVNMDSINNIDPDNISLDSVKSLKKYTDINYLKTQLINYFFVVLLPAITNIINYAIKLATDKLTELEKHKTKTQMLASFIIKNILTRFLNTAVIYYILAMLHEEIGPLTQEGMVIKVMGLVGVSALSHTLTQLIRPQVVYDYFFNNYNDKFENVESEDVTQKLFQIQLNQQLQDPEFAFADQYTFYVVMTLLVSFYAVIAPASVMILIAMFIVQYWLDKYNLFRRFSCPLDFDFVLTKLIFKAFECSLLIFAIGNLLLDRKIRLTNDPKYDMVNLINLAIAGLYVGISILSPSRIQQKFFKFEKEELDHKSYGYYLKKKYFKKVYWTENPVTAFLKERNINQQKGKIEDDFVQSPEDDKFIKAEQFNKYIHLNEEDIKYEIYDDEEVKYIQNYENDDYFYEEDQPEEGEAGEAGKADEANPDQQ